jgi:hypothetical protein
MIYLLALCLLVWVPIIGNFVCPVIGTEPSGKHSEWYLGSDSRIIQYRHRKAVALWQP